MKDHTFSRRSLALGAVALSTTGFTLSPTIAQTQNSPLKVVATFSIIGDWVQNCGGEHIQLTTIVPAGGDAHTFDPSPAQVASIAEADLLFEIGIGFETWLDDMIDASGSTAERVTLSEGIDLLEAGHDEHADEDDGEGDDHEDEADHADDDGHDHGPFDPHIWGDVANAVYAVVTIRDSLTATDPDRAGDYEANAEAYLAQLDALDTNVREHTATLPDDRRKLVTTHDTFGYYAQAYGFEIVGTALSSLSTEGGDPPASEIASLVDAIQKSGVPAIFAENVAGSTLMEAIAAEAGVSLAPTLFSDALGDAESEAPTYIAMMKYNTATIVTALGEN